MFDENPSLCVDEVGENIFNFPIKGFEFFHSPEY